MGWSNTENEKRIVSVYARAILLAKLISQELLINKHNNNVIITTNWGQKSHHVIYQYSIVTKKHLTPFSSTGIKVIIPAPLNIVTLQI